MPVLLAVLVAPPHRANPAATLPVSVGGWSRPARSHWASGGSAGRLSPVMFAQERALRREPGARWSQLGRRPAASNAPGISVAGCEGGKCTAHLSISRRTRYASGHQLSLCCLVTWQPPPSLIQCRTRRHEVLVHMHSAPLRGRAALLQLAPCVLALPSSAGEGV